jgi:hypothetical protein
MGIAPGPLKGDDASYAMLRAKTKTPSLYPVILLRLFLIRPTHRPCS